MTDLLLPRGSTKYKEQVQKLLDSQPAVKKDRAGELALGNSFLGLPGRGVVSRLGVQGRLKNRVGGAGAGVKWPGGGAAQAREAGPTWKLQKRNFTSTRVILCIFLAFSLRFFLHLFLHFFAFFCIFFAFPRLGVIFFAFLFAFPRLGVIFWALFCISQTGSHFLHFFAFPRPGLPPSPLAWSLWENDKKMNNARK